MQSRLRPCIVDEWQHSPLVYHKTQDWTRIRTRFKMQAQIHYQMRMHFCYHLAKVSSDFDVCLSLKRRQTMLCHHNTRLT